MVTLLCGVVVCYCFEDFFGVEEEGGHFPDCGFEVHAGEFEGPFQYARHLEATILSAGGCGAEGAIVGGVVAGEGDVWVHLGGGWKLFWWL